MHIAKSNSEFLLSTFTIFAVSSQHSSGTAFHIINLSSISDVKGQDAVFAQLNQSQLVRISCKGLMTPIYIWSRSILAVLSDGGMRLFIRREQGSDIYNTIYSEISRSKPFLE